MRLEPAPAVPPGRVAHTSPTSWRDDVAVTEPLASGMLNVGDGHRVHWESAGNPAGKPALILHGGPGSGSNPRTRRLFNPARYLIVQFDQRQCGLGAP